MDEYGILNIRVRSGPGPTGGDCCADPYRGGRMSGEGDRLQILLDHPELLGQEVGFTDLTPLHGQWRSTLIP